MQTSSVKVAIIQLQNQELSVHELIAWQNIFCIWVFLQVSGMISKWAFWVGTQIFQSIFGAVTL